MPARLLASLAIGAAVVLGVPGAAAAQGGTTNPFTPGLPAAPQSTPTQTATTPVITTPSTTSTGGNGLSGGSAVAIAIGAIVLLGGISLFIWRDARRRAPVRHRAALDDASRAASKARVKPRKLSPAERRRRKRGRAR